MAHGTGCSEVREDVSGCVASTSCPVQGLQAVKGCADVSPPQPGLRTVLRGPVESSTPKFPKQVPHLQRVGQGQGFELFESKSRRPLWSRLPKSKVATPITGLVAWESCAAAIK